MNIKPENKTQIFYSKIINDMVTYVAVLEPDGTVLFANNAPLEVAGITLADVVGKKLYDTYWWQYSKKARLSIKSDIERCTNGEALIHETKILAKDLTKIWIDFSMHPIFDDQGNVCNVVAEGRDITERKNAAHKLKKSQATLERVKRLEAIGQLAGGVAHDFNNMLNVIIGYTELMTLKLKPNDSILKYLKEIKKAAKHSADITRQLLAFSRQQVIKPKVIEVNPVITSMKKMISRLIGEDIDILLFPGKDLWRIKVDPSQIDQVIANLAVNARDAMPNGGKLTLETANVTFDDTYCSEHAGFIPGQFVMIAMSDDGTGIDKEIMPHIFEPFFTSKGEGKGTGLGLATVYGIVKQNNGFINVYSEPEKGTTFKIYVPRCMEEGKQAEKLAEKTPTSATGIILLVEDDEMVRNLTMRMLESIGYTVIVAATPDEAITYCKKDNRDFDLLLTDVIMPQMNGKELKNAIEAIKPGIKTLFMSGYTANVIARHGVLEEGVNFIQKPFNRYKLAKEIRRAIEYVNSI